MNKLSYPSAPFVEARHVGGKQKPKAIVIKSSFTTSETGAALGIASFWHQKNSPLLSSHYILDEVNTYHCVPDNKVAYHHPFYNHDTLGVYICSEPLTELSFWDDSEHAKLLNRTSDLIAHLINFYKIKVQYLDDEAMNRWDRRKRKSQGGIYIAVEGVFPKTEFLNDLKVRVRELKHTK